MPIILHMRKLAGFSLSFGLLSAIFAQSVPSTTAPQSEFRIVKLPPASYPPIPQAARVFGWVVLNITLKPDGSVDSADVVSGPQMLRAAAIESARQMQFDCKACAAGTAQFQISFNYEINWEYSCDAPDKSYPRVSESNGTVKFTGQPPSTCDPALTRVRAAKCLYLWKCGLR